MRNDMRNIYHKKQINLIIMAVLSLMVLFFVPQKAQAATVKRPSQVKNLTVKLTAKNKVKLTWKKGCKDLRIFIIQGNIIKKFDTEYGFADVKLSK